MAIYNKTELIRTNIAISGSGGTLEIVKEWKRVLPNGEPVTKLYLLVSGVLRKEGRTWDQTWDFEIDKKILEAAFLDAETLDELTNRPSHGRVPIQRNYLTLDKDVTLGRAYNGIEWVTYIRFERDGLFIELTLDVAVKDFLMDVFKASNKNTF